MSTLNFEDFDAPLVFRSRPESIPGDLRPVWRICVILLILELASRGKKSSISKLHVLNWAIRSKENQKVLRQIINGEMSPDSISVRVEPSLDRAVSLAYGEELVEFVGGKNIRLTWQGESAVKKIIGLEDVFLEEKSFLLEIGKSKLTETVVTEFFTEGQKNK